MSRLPKVSGKEVLAALLRAGFREVHAGEATTTWSRLKAARC